MSNPSYFSRPTVIAASNLLTEFTQKELDNLMLQFGLEDRISAGPECPKQYKANDLSKIALTEPDRLVETSTGTMSLQEAIVRQAMAVPPRARHKESWTSFSNGLKRDGFVLVENEEIPSIELRRMLPAVADVAAADDEIHRLLRTHGFTIPLGHLQQAISAHSRGEWAGANSQLRTFVESILDEIALRLAPEIARETPSGHRRRALLANLNPPFLSHSLNEWRDDQNVRRQNNRDCLMRLLTEASAHLGLQFRRLLAGAASGDARWSFA